MIIYYMIILNVISMTITKGNQLETSTPHNVSLDDSPIVDSGEWEPIKWFTIRMHFPPPYLTDFGEVLSQVEHIVDKTLFIRKFLKLSENGTIVINQPFGWGKTFNVEMLRRFFQIEVDKEGVELPEKKKMNRVLFMGGKLVVGVQYTMLQPLKIAKYNDIVEKYFAKHPVILFGFKDVYNHSINTMKGLIAKKLLDLYNKEFPYLVKYCNPNDTSIENLNKAELKNYFTRKIYPDSKFGDSLRLLSRLLYEYFKKKVIILIDDYDEPIHRALQKYGRESKQFQTIMNVIEGMLGAATKNNPYVERSMFTGTFPFNDFGPRLDNLKHYTVQDGVFVNYYGFSEKEVKTLLSHISTNVTIDDLRMWYNGFNFSGKPIYNPPSVLQCLNKYEGRVERYAFLEDRLNFLGPKALSLEYQRGFHSLLSNKPKFYFYSMDAGTPSNDLYFYLFFAGYVKAKKENSFGDYYISVPNYEAMSAYQKIQLRWTTDELELPENWHYTPGVLLGHCKTKGFETTLGEMLNKSTVLNHLYGPNAAVDGIHYNGLLLSITESFPSDMIVICESEPVITGKIELLFAPSVTSKIREGIILEYKISTSKDDRIRVQASVGAKTIDLQKYESRLKPFTYLNEIYKIFIVFRGTELAVGEHIVPFPKFE